MGFKKSVVWALESVLKVPLEFQFHFKFRCSTPILNPRLLIFFFFKSSLLWKSQRNGSLVRNGLVYCCILKGPHFLWGVRNLPPFLPSSCRMMPPLSPPPVLLFICFLPFFSYLFFKKRTQHTQTRRQVRCEREGGGCGVALATRGAASDLAHPPTIRRTRA